MSVYKDICIYNGTSLNGHLILADNLTLMDTF